MLTLILGQNSIGKSYTLERIKENSTDIISYNTMDIQDIYSREYSTERLEILSNNKYIDSIEYENIKLSIKSIYEISNNFEKLLYIICKQSDILLLDEAELELTKTETSILVHILYDLIDTFKNVYIVTHDNTFLFLTEHPNTEVYTVKTEANEMQLLKINKEEAYETID